MLFAAAALATCLSAPCLAADISATITAAVTDSARPAADIERDAQRKPAEILAFSGIKPGVQIAELIPGGGYFTRLLSVAAGSDGHVYALVPPPRPNVPDSTAAINALAADTHYGNITVLPLSYAEGPSGLPQPVDVVLTSDNYHDIHNALGDAGMVDFNKRVFAALKPGGLYIVIDHATAAGRGASDTRTLHRIDPETVKTEAVAAGFQFAGASDTLRNADDPHTAKVFDPSIRGKTDQFALKFVKP
jgi:predicted methyltransferase